MRSILDRDASLPVGIFSFFILSLAQAGYLNIYFSRFSGNVINSLLHIHS